MFFDNVGPYLKKKKQNRKTEKQKKNSFIHCLSHKLKFVLWCMLVSVLHMWSDQWNAPPWYSIGTVLDNVKDTDKNK